MSQYSPDYKQQSQAYYSPPQSQPQRQCSPEFQPASFGPPPHTQQPYPFYNEHQAQPQYSNAPSYNQSGQAVDTPHQYHPTGENASYYNPEPSANPTSTHAPEGEGEEREKGLGSTVVGGAAGGYMGHKMGGGWSTAAGAAIGAVGMNVVSHMMKKPEPAPLQQVPVQQVPVQQVVAVPAGGMGLGLGGRLAQRRQMRRGLLGL
ncbi:hypothetical protein BJX61DRAFT_512229 [Aspergillus egyptiacus]|nr:hypothetical protein BJX61DRAFT_512229 [Aspergillus egyptiacus]